MCRLETFLHELGSSKSVYLFFKASRHTEKGMASKQIESSNPPKGVTSNNFN